VQGDSGGPLVIKNATSGVATVVGVVSFGIGCGQPNYYGVYTDVFQFLPWIRSIIGVRNFSIVYYRYDHTYSEFHELKIIFDSILTTFEVHFIF
jgi:secreted trypsin-like serine protease